MSMEAPPTGDEAVTVRCVGCGATFASACCPQCGERRRPQRLTIASLVEDLFTRLTDLDFKVLRTIRNMLWRPAWVPLRYIEGTRRAFTGPLKFCFVFGAMAAFFGSMQPEVAEPFKDLRATLTDAQALDLLDLLEPTQVFLASWVHVMTFTSLPLLAVLMWATFGLIGWMVPRVADDRNLCEHLVVAYYAYGIIFLIQGVSIPFGLFRVMPFSIILPALPLVWYPWAAVGFFRTRWWIVVPVSLIATLVYVLIANVVWLGGHLLYRRLTGDLVLPEWMVG